MCLGGCAANGKGNRPPVPPVGTASAAKTGIIGLDARWSEYGVYLNDLVETVQSQWYKILNESRIAPPRATIVTVKFRLSSKGEVEIIQIEDHGTGKQAIFACMNAITYPMPYPKWTDRMIATFGDSQEITFSFYYQ